MHTQAVPHADRLAESFCDLLYRIRRDEPAVSPSCAHPYHCDVLIIGSGYGGAVSAAALSETLQPNAPQHRIWLFERGLHHLPGQFPSQLADLAGHARFNTPNSPCTAGRRSGLFDMRVSHDAGVILANGLGGGSLINAGVMAWPQDEVFDQSPWPAEIRHDRAALRQQSERMKQRLGAALADGQNNTVGRQKVRTIKLDALHRMASGTPAAAFQPLPITVAMREGDRSSDGMGLRACLRCGDCATGCNHGAKISLDTNLLHAAARRGVRLFTGATVMRIEPMDGAPGWRVHVQHTDEQAQWREGEPIVLHARRVVLAAGSLGSTGILMRSRSPRMSLSRQLGEGFSGNGDLLMAAYRQEAAAQAMADETMPPAHRDIGPTITGMLDRRQPASTRQDLHRGYVIQDLAIPGALRRLFEEATLTAKTVDDIGRPDPLRGTEESADRHDPAAINPAHMRHTLPLAMMGHDDASGRLRLVDTGPAPQHPSLACDSNLIVEWPGLRHDPRFDRQLDELQALCDASGAGGTVMPNPLWRPPVGAMGRGSHRGPLLIAHPLGGCRMGDTRREGVVNHLGQVFDAAADATTAVHEGLVVLDGAMVPSSLGINPALTIATLSERAITQLLHTDWQDLGTRQPDQAAPSERPMLPAPSLPPDIPTTIEITEQMRGWVGPVGIELSLRFKPVAVRDLLRAHPMKRTLELDASYSRLRVIARPDEITHDSWNKQAPVLLAAQLSGTLCALHDDDSSHAERVRQALPAWLRNRGMRDVSQGLARWISGHRHNDVRLRRVLSSLYHTASQAGEVRLFDYDLRLERVTQQAGPWADMVSLEGQRIHGHKRITYARRANPWRQLTTMALTQFPGLPLDGITERTLTLHLSHLADMGVPLLRVVRQRDLPTTLMDLISLALLITRLLARIHIWSFSPSDRSLREGPPTEAYGRLPSAMPGLPPPRIERLITSAPHDTARLARIQLTRYPAQIDAPRRAPIVMLHGYSASGTSFAHPSLRPGLASYLWDRGHDIWIVDLRTSSGLPDTAIQAWTFEDVALQDIPIALTHIADRSLTGQIDVVAHCMGSTMLWMALLAPDLQALSTHPTAQQALQRLQGLQGGGLIRRLCMSQVAPIVHFSEANILRAFVLRYVRQFLPLGPYHFERPDVRQRQQRMLSDLMDMLLATLPYPESEWDIEHPSGMPWRRAPWSRTRRRMDMLFGRAFHLSSMSSRVLQQIDDFFGPMNLNTLSQVLHMARSRTPTDASGRAIYLDQQRLAHAMDTMQAMMSIHGEQNGLSDISGMHAFAHYVRNLGPRYRDKYQIASIPDKGHQDCLIGEDLDAPGAVFPRIASFFEPPT